MKTRLAAALLLVPVPALAAGGAGASAPTQPASRLQVAMTLYAGGITIGSMDLDATLRGADYRAVSHLETKGVVNALWQAQIQATASGTLGTGTLIPKLYDSFYSGPGGKKQEVSLSYESGAPKLYADPVYSTTGYDVKPEDSKASLDPLSAILLITSGVAAKNGDACALTAPVFDGRRRYNIEMTRVRDIDVHMDNGLYAGKAVQCDIRYKQIAGFRPGVIKANESFPLIHAWIARFPSPVTGRDYTVPVRVWAQTKYGVMAVLATGVQVDGKAPAGVKN